MTSAAAPPGTIVQFLFDVVSPYSYLAAMRIEDVVARARPEATIAWRPVLLGGITKALASKTPLDVPHKARYMARDLADWAAYFQVPFRYPRRFPTSTLLAQRVLTAAAPADRAALAKALFAAYWGAGEDVADQAVVVAAIVGAGHDPAPLMAAAETQAIKDALRAETDDAVRRGAFGVPTMFVGDHMFWGQDRLELLAWHLERLRAP
ncbi:MAG: 2-hydroxychromene-2-carboxylate isomerase [Deltaproteobacteria bacterium]|nr:2-hydroxychromene-2-carboxylate isomerase [Deltaproteobacteria bacterium]